MKKKKVLTIIGVLLVVCFCLFTSCLGLFAVFQPFEMNGNSMEPSIHNGEMILLNKLTTPKQGDIIIYKQSGVSLIKRVVAVGGDKVIFKDGKVFINGEAEDPNQYGIEKIVKTDVFPFSTKFRDNVEFTVPEGRFLVLGDNRTVSKDSRYDGFVDKKDIIGVYAFTYWPLSSFGK